MQIDPATTAKKNGYLEIFHSGAYWLWLPGVATIALRLACLPDFIQSIFFIPLGGDRGLYHQVATALAEGHGWPQVFTFMPLYPGLLGGLYRLIGGPNLAAVAILQALLDGLTTLLIGRLAERHYGRAAAFLAGFGFCLLGAAATYSLVTMPVSLGLFWTALATFMADLWHDRWTTWRAAIMGWLLGLGGQILGAFWLMLIPFSILIAAAPPREWRQRLWHGLLVAIIGALCVVPSLAHNLRYGQGWVPVAGHSGLNLYMGNHANADGYGTIIPGLRASAEEMSRDSVWLASYVSRKQLSMAEADHFWKQQVYRFWRESPGQALKVMWRKGLRLINVRDFDDTGVCRLFPQVIPGLRLAFLGFGAIWLLACAGWGVRTPRYSQTGGWIIGLSLAAGILLTFMNTRYRLPLAVVLLPAAAGTVTALFRRQWRAWNIRKTRFGLGIIGGLIALFPLSRPDTGAADHCNLAVYYLQQGASSQAMTHARAALADCPDSPQAWFVLGNTHMLTGDYPAAWQAYQQTLRILPFRTDALLNAGRALQAMGEKDKAVEYYQQAVTIDPRYAKAWFALAMLYHETGKHAQALNAAAKAVELAGSADPDIRQLQQQLQKDPGSESSGAF